jgi:hypothetical protein
LRLIQHVADVVQPDGADVVACTFCSLIVNTKCDPEENVSVAVIVYVLAPRAQVMLKNLFVAGR